MRFVGLACALTLVMTASPWGSASLTAQQPGQTAAPDSPPPRSDSTSATPCVANASGATSRWPAFVARPSV